MFSILFKKPFVAVGGNSDARIENLLRMLGLESRAVSNVNDVLNMESIFSVDYSKTEKKLTAEREKTKDYLDKALGVK